MGGKTAVRDPHGSHALRKYARTFAVCCAAVVSVACSLAGAAPAPAGPSAPAPSTSAPSPSVTAPASPEARADRFLDSIVRVDARIVGDAHTRETLGLERSGSGVVLDARTVLTIGYLIVEAEQVDVITVSGRKLPANVAGYDHETGFGIVRTLVPIDGQPLELGDSDGVTERQKVFTLGYGEDGVTELRVVSRKSFTGTWEYLLESAIFTFPPVNNWSGAALIDEGGKLVGIGSLIVRDAAASTAGIPGNLFVPVNLIKPILPEMLRNGKRAGPTHPWLGLATETVHGHLIIVNVTPGGPAESAGLSSGDIILKVNGANVAEPADFYRHVWKLGSAGVKVPLRVLSSGEVRELDVQSMDRADFLKKPRGI